MNSTTGQLPALYTSAQHALATCERIDECKDWADKAQAMASYARQAKDESLRKHADRIQARAIRRCGELLQQLPADKGGRPPETRGDAPPSLTRTQAAVDAGLSRDQRRTALRVASVPKDSFDAQVESDSPPTVTELARQGTQYAPRAESRGTGLRYAAAAINELGRIPQDDGLRQDAFEMVITWINANR
jgi:hypothetical protein